MSDTHRQHHRKWKKILTQSLKSGMRKGCPLFPLIFNIILKVVAGAIELMQEIKGIQIKKHKYPYFQMT